MNKTEERAYHIARFISSPADGIEIGGVSSQLLDIVKTITINNTKLKDRVFDWFEYLVEEGNYSTKLFGTDNEQALQEMKKDYIRVFYKK